MFSYLWLLIKRAAVLLPGIVVAYFSARDVFPYFHQRLPFAIAIFITYVIGAYLLVPALMRLRLLIIHPKHLPVYCVTPDGFASDPLNIGVIGTREQLIDTMRAVGWHVAKPIGIRSALATIGNIILNRPYDGAPLSRLYLFGRKQDIAFEMQRADQGRGNRHHVRFWATTYQSIASLSPQTIDWDDRKEELTDGRILWVGAASRDIGVTFTKQSLQFTHAVDPDTNAERELIVEQLSNTGLANLLTTIRLHRAYSLINRAWFVTLHTDGKMAILHLQK